MAAVALPWFIWSWVALGSAIPDTLVIKLFAGWGMWNFTNGWQLYLGLYPFFTIVSAVMPVLGLMGLLAWVPARVRAGRTASAVARLDAFAGLAAGGVAYYIAYTQLGVSPYHWYYAPTITALSIAAAALIGWAACRFRHGVLRWIALSTATSSAAFAALLLALVRVHGMPWAQSPIMSNGTTPGEYARMGQELHKRVGSATVGSADEIGTLAYFCHCTITDGFVDRGYIPDQIRQREEQLSPVSRWLLRLNYRYFDRSATPRPLDYQLHRVPGPGPDPILTGSSRWASTNHFELGDLRAPAP
ncbi:hypothetical protein QFW96_13140 [Saccharopolyspora sp. TS4A08]|uniref:Uncharacterized protein n=1 Tax=Saccharopolyspora ipomoeae TaxID=3042027 RepID=A0ABT6PNI3_9PSEU|nr:hypothetical protein [Saccharopolyspora sp. TS4A08]MDI2029568.1 hypothetical protein [Saccharopolyspora sp. TS4A08]